MSWWFLGGVLLFALGIGVSIALHEFGHLGVAKLFGMKVRRYFIGFGPRVWSFRRGETEYGLKAIPAGGFCEIAGMTALDELEPDEEPRAMYGKPAYQRIAVLLAGVVMNFIVGLILIYTLATVWGLPDITDQTRATEIGSLGCVAPTQAPNGDLAPCSGAGPAQKAGLEVGDVITAVDGHTVKSWPAMTARIQDSIGTVPVRIERDGRTETVSVTVERVERQVRESPGADPEPRTVGAIGIGGVAPAPWREYTPLSAVGGALGFTGDMAVLSLRGLIDLPSRIPAVVSAIGGGDRDDDTPISVVGASRMGGDLAEVRAWPMFVLLLAQLNFFLGLVNLLPLLPFDGGHIAVVLYEKARDRIRRIRGREALPPVDYTRLLPVTLTVAVLLGGIMLLTVTADIVNPIRLF